MAIDDKYRTGFRRWAAAFIDGLIFIPITSIDKTIQNHITTNIGLFLWITFVTILTISYSVLMHYKFGQTLGKMAMKVKVIHFDELNSLTLKQAFIRDIFYIIIELISLIYFATQLFNSTSDTNYIVLNFDTYVALISLIWVLLELVSMLTNDKRRAIHDYIANTVVLKLDA